MGSWNLRLGVFLALIVNLEEYKDPRNRLRGTVKSWGPKEERIVFLHFSLYSTALNGVLLHGAGPCAPHWQVHLQ